MRMETTIALRPCPFCGAENPVMRCSDSGCYWVECSRAYNPDNPQAEDEICGCAISLPEVYGFNSEEDVAEAWNKRV